MRLKIIFLILISLQYANLYGQTAQVVGLRENTPSVFALTNAHIIPEPGKAIPSGTVIIRDGYIIEVGQRVSIPSDAMEIDMKGYYIYPGI